MKKKLIALMVLLVITLQSLSNIAFAENLAEDWNVIYHGTNNTDTSKYYAQLTTQYKYTGTQALLFKYKPSSVTEVDYIEVKNPLTTKMETAAYNLSFYWKGNTSENVKISVGGQKYWSIKDSQWITQDDNGWKKYSISFDFTEQTENYLTFKIYGGITTAALDNVSLTKNGTNTNIVYNSDFEEEFKEPETDDGDDSESIEAEYDVTGYNPTDLMISSFDGGLAPSWKNPVCNELKSIELYQVNSDDDVLLKNDFPVTASKINTFAVKGLTDNEDYLFKLVFNYNNKEPYVYYLSGKPGSSKSREYGSWTVTEVRSGAAGYSPITSCIDTDVKKSGNASLKIVSNNDRTVEEFKSNIYMSITQNLPLETGKKYRYTMYIKGDAQAENVECHLNWTKFGNNPIKVENSSGTYNWKRIEYDFEFDKETKLVINVDSKNNGFWIDDVSLVELDKDTGDVISDNLVKDGGFEDILKEDVGNISNFVSTAKMGAVDLSWILNEASGECTKINIYEKKFGEYYYRGFIPKTLTELNCNNLKINRTYDYMLRPVNEWNYEGIGVSAAARTLVPDYQIDEARIFRTNEVQSLGAKGTYTAKVQVKNNYIEAGLPVEQIVVLYKDGRVYKVTSAEKVVKKTHLSSTPSTISTTFEIQDGTGYHIEIFVVSPREQADTIIFNDVKKYYQ